MKKIIYSIMAFAIAIFTLTSCESVPMPYDLPEQGGDTSGVDPTGSGTVDDPYNIAALNDFARNLDQGTSSDGLVYFRGKVVSFKSGEEPGNTYGNATFYMSDDGSSTNQFYVYRCKGPGNTKITDPNLFKVGDELVVCGKITNYNGTLETEQNTAYIVSINGEGSDVPGSTAEPAGTGTATDPFNVAGVIAYTSALAADVNSDKEVYFTGIVESFKDGEEPGNSFGNATFYIKDENASATFYCFRVLGPGNKKFTSADQLKVGDKVLMCGTVVNYKGNTPETVTGKAYVVSINGEGDTDGGGDIPTVEPKGTGTAADPFNVAAAIKKAQETGETETSTEYYIKGKVLANNTTASTISQYGNMTFTMVDEGTTTPVFTAYQVYGPGKEKFTSVDQIKPGQTVVVCGKIVNYKNNTPETVGKGASYVVSIGGEGESGGDTPSAGSSDGISISGTTVTLNNASATADTETVTLIVNDLGLADKASAEGTYTLSDGSTLTVAKGDGKTGPTYYAATNGFRIYASNTLTFNGKKNIKSIEITCDSYNGTNYVGNATATVSFEGSKVAYCNYMDGNSGGVQLRAQKFVITYAK